MFQIETYYLVESNRFQIKSFRGQKTIMNKLLKNAFLQLFQHVVKKVCFKLRQTIKMAVLLITMQVWALSQFETYFCQKSASNPYDQRLRTTSFLLPLIFKNWPLKKICLNLKHIYLKPHNSLDLFVYFFWE